MRYEAGTFLHDIDCASENAVITIFISNLGICWICDDSFVMSFIWLNTQVDRGSQQTALQVAHGYWVLYCGDRIRSFEAVFFESEHTSKAQEHQSRRLDQRVMIDVSILLSTDSAVDFAIRVREVNKVRVNLLL